MSAETEIRTYAERIVSLEIERRERAADIKDIKAEAKGQGYSPKLIAACVRMLLLEADKRATALSDHEELDLYLSACGLLSDRLNEAPRGDQGDGGVAATAAPSQSVEKVVPEATAKGDGPMPAAGPAADEAVGSNSPDGAYEPTPGADTSAQLDASGQRQATAAAHGSATPALGSVGSSVRGGTLTSEPVRKSGVTAGERPGTHSVARHSRDPSPAEMVGASA